MTRVKKVLAGIAALAALAFGGAAIANAGGGTDHQATPPASQNQAANQDRSQVGDEKGDDANEKADSETEDDANEKADSETEDDANEQPGSETNDDSDQGEMELPGQ